MLGRTSWLTVGLEVVACRCQSCVFFSFLARFVSWPGPYPLLSRLRYPARSSAPDRGDGNGNGAQHPWRLLLAYVPYPGVAYSMGALLAHPEEACPQ